MPDLSAEKIFPGGIHVSALFDAEVKWRLVEEFGPHCFKEQEDGRLLFEADYTEFQNLFSWLMTFGSAVEVLKPKEVRHALWKAAKKMAVVYEKGGERP